MAIKEIAGTYLLENVQLQWIQLKLGVGKRLTDNGKQLRINKKYTIMHTYIKYKVLDWITNNVINTLDRIYSYETKDVVALPNIYF